MSGPGVIVKDPDILGGTGKERDSETGLDYFGARYFSSAQGRFTSPDPLVHPSESQVGEQTFLSEPQRWNKYSYVSNNPLRYTDPDGRELIDLPAAGRMLIDAGKGFLKGAANVAIQADNALGEKLNSLGIGNHQPHDEFQADSPLQQEMMGVGGVAAAAVLTRGEAPLSDDALVVRGGVRVSDAAVGTHPSGVTGISVESANGKTVEQLATESPTVSKYGQVRCCTVGDVRAAGGDVIPTKGGSPNHATLTGLPATKINEILNPPIPNPAKQPNQE